MQLLLARRRNRETDREVGEGGGSGRNSCKRVKQARKKQEQCTQPSRPPQPEHAALPLEGATKRVHDTTVTKRGASLPQQASCRQQLQQETTLFFPPPLRSCHNCDDYGCAVEPRSAHMQLSVPQCELSADNLFPRYQSAVAAWLLFCAVFVLRSRRSTIHNRHHTNYQRICLRRVPPQSDYQLNCTQHLANQHHPRVNEGVAIGRWTEPASYIMRVCASLLETALGSGYQQVSCSSACHGVDSPVVNAPA